MLEKLKKTFLYFSILFAIAGVSFFIAYNWKDMGNITKMSIPLSLILLGTAGWYIFEKKDIYRELSIFSASFFIGSLFAVFGQIYQTGADIYTLFLNWGLLMLIFSYAEKFYPLWFLNITVFTTSGMLYSRLFFNMGLVFVTGGVILFLALLLYLGGIKKFNLLYKGWFFYTIAVSGLGLTTVGTALSIIDSSWLYRYKDFLGWTAFPIYLVLLAGNWCIGKLWLKKQGMLVLSIASFTMILTSFIIKAAIKSRGEVEELTFYTFLIICVFSGSIAIIVKKYISSKGIRLIVNFFKTLLILFGLIFIGLIMTLLGFGDEMLLVGGLILLGVSCMLPNILKFTEDKNEIVTFICGTLLILFYFSQQNIPAMILVGIGYVIFTLFWYFKHSVPLDYLMVPVFILGIWYIGFVRNIYDNTHIILMPLIFIFLSLFMEKKNFKWLNRASTGTEILLMGMGIFLYETTPEFSYLPYAVDGVMLAISLKILYRIFNKKHYTAYILIAVLVSFICFLNLHIFGINLGIMLILLYLYRDEKFMLGTGVIFLGASLSFYYYSLNITLLDKSYLMLKSGAVLFIGFIILNRALLKEKAGEEL